MDGAAKFIKNLFGDKNFYEILGVGRSASCDEIKRAYRKLALVYHPDRCGGDTEKFKALSMVHCILSDQSKRAVYDETGEVDGEDNSEDFANWYEYFRTLFPKLTISKIEEFSKTYKGSKEERDDLTDAYKRFKGKMEKVMEVVMFAEEGEEGRLCETIDNIIDSGELKTTRAYEEFKSRMLTADGKSKKSKSSKRKRNDEDSQAALEAMILANQSARRSSGGFGAIFAKYGGAAAAAAGAGEDDIDDEAFMEAQRRVCGEKKKSTTTTKKAEKEGKNKKK